MPQKNLRLPIATLEQIAALAPFYATEATVVAVAVQALYDKYTDNVQAVEQEIINRTRTVRTPTTNDHQRDDQ